jgi:hypothetical protein
MVFLLALWGFCCDRYCGLGFSGASYFLLRSLPRVWVFWRILFPAAIATAGWVFWRIVFPSAIATAGLAWDYIFYFH